MAPTRKLSISMPEAEYRSLETARRQSGKTRSQFIREALEVKRAEAKDVGSGGFFEARQYEGSPLPPEIRDASELKRRAIAAIGRFDSGVPDLSLEHDKYLAGAADDGGGDQTEPGRPGRRVSRDRDRP
jgi:hypothetical protein